MNESILQVFNARLRTMLLTRTGVLSDKLRAVESVEGELCFSDSSPKAKNIDVLVLGREHYKEQKRNFPIQSRRELNKILALEAQSAEQIMLYRIGEYLEGQRQVQVWTVSPDVLSAQGLTPFLIIPESALLLSAKGHQVLSVERQGRTFWFANSKEGRLSAEKKGLISSAQMFLASAGLSEQIPQKVLTDDYLAALFADFIVVTLGNIQGFNAHLRKMDSKDWQRHGLYSGGVAALMLSAYFALGSVYLNVRLANAEQTQTELSSQTKDVFDLQAERRRLDEKTAQLKQVLDQRQASNIPWRLIVPMLKNGVTINRFGLMPNGTYTLACVADKATSVLDFINKDPAVSQPKFSGQVNNYDGKDFFTVEFTIKQGG